MYFSHSGQTNWTHLKVRKLIIVVKLTKSKFPQSGITMTQPHNLQAQECLKTSCQVVTNDTAWANQIINILVHVTELF